MLGKENIIILCFCLRKRRAGKLRDVVAERRLAAFQHGAPTARLNQRKNVRILQNTFCYGNEQEGKRNTVAET